jgi:hypothetical protein
VRGAVLCLLCIFAYRPCVVCWCDVLGLCVYMLSCLRVLLSCVWCVVCVDRVCIVDDPTNRRSFEG